MIYEMSKHIDKTDLSVHHSPVQLSLSWFLTGMYHGVMPFSNHGLPWSTEYDIINDVIQWYILGIFTITSWYIVMNHVIASGTMINHSIAWMYPGNV